MSLGLARADSLSYLLSPTWMLIERLKSPIAAALRSTKVRNDEYLGLYCIGAGLDLPG
jgi:hypothetical protein